MSRLGRFPIVLPGVCWAVVVVALGVTAGCLYFFGVPGSPEPQTPYLFQPEQSMIKAYFGPASSPRTDSWPTSFSDGARSGLALSVNPGGPSQLVAVELDGGARSTRVVPANIFSFQTGRKVDPIRTVGKITGADKDVYFFSIGPHFGSSVFVMYGQQDDIWRRDNARVRVQTPRLEANAICDPSVDFRRLSSSTEAAWDDERGRCADVTDGSSTVSFGFSASTDVPNLKVDYSNSPPTDTDRLEWSNPAGLQVVTNLTMIDAEARGQALLFFSGILGGGALGLLPTLAASLRKVQQRLGAPTPNPTRNPPPSPPPTRPPRRVRLNQR